MIRVYSIRSNRCRRVLFYAYTASILVIPNNVKTIESIGNSLAEIIIISQGVTAIESLHSGFMSNYEDVYIPDSVKIIKDNLFSSGKTIHCNKGSCAEQYAIKNNIKCEYDKPVIISGEGTGSVAIPSGVKTIGKNAFRGCKLTSVTIPNTVTTIGDDAFEGSTITSVIIPNSVTTIGKGAFSSSCITSITIPNGITKIEGAAFSECRKLTSVTIPNSVTIIGGGAFENCDALTSITIPNSMTTIERAAFAGCHKLASITIPSSVIAIGDAAFPYNENFIINCYAGSYADTYAKDHYVMLAKDKGIKVNYLK